MRGFSKYSNKKTTLDGITFASVREANRYAELSLLQKGKVISNLITQPVYLLQEAFTDKTGKKHQPLTYLADFSYIEKGEVIVEDVKGMKTDVYKIKKKLLLYKYPDINFREI